MLNEVPENVCKLYQPRVNKATGHSGKIWDKSQEDDNHPRNLEGKNNSHLPDQCHFPTSISGNYLPQEAFTGKKKKLVSWNLNSVYLWKPPGKIAWLSTLQWCASVLFDLCLTGVGEEIGESPDQRWDLSGVTGGTQDDPTLDFWPNRQSSGVGIQPTNLMIFALYLSLGNILILFDKWLV